MILPTDSRNRRRDGKNDDADEDDDCRWTSPTDGIDDEIAVERGDKYDGYGEEIGDDLPVGGDETSLGCWLRRSWKKQKRVLGWDTGKEFILVKL